ncbi:DUF1700 domain-containing protein [Mycoplasmatota bacterium WC30]
MDKLTFINTLSKKLKENKVADIEEIISEYEEHFFYRLEDGYTEEEVSKKLGDPVFLADQYLETEEKEEANRKFITITGLIVSDFFVGMFYITFAAWIVVLVAFSTAVLGIGFSYIFNISPFNLIPYLPYWCGAIFGVAMIGLAALSYIGSLYSLLSMKQITKSYARFHKNTIAKTNGNPMLPSLSSHPIISRRMSRRLRSTLLLSLYTFAIAFVLGYIVCSVTANSFEFWHVFEWFV